MSSARGTWIALGAAAALGLVYWGWDVKLKPQREKDKEDAKLLFKDLDASSTSEILLRKKGSADVQLRRVDGQWRLITPTAAPADDAAVSALVSQLAQAKRNEIIVDKGADLHEFGLDDPSGAVTFKPTSPGAKAEVLFFGLDSPTGSEAYGFIDGKPEVFLTYLSVKNAVLKDAASLRDKSVWKFDPSDVEAVSSDLSGFTVARDKNGFWQVDAGARHEPGKGTAVDAWLGELSRVKADSVPSETGKGSYGLSAGKRLALTLKSGTQIVLVEGGKAKPGVFVQLSGQGPVFQLNQAAADTLGKKAVELMDLNVFNFQTGDVARMEIERPTGKLTAIKKVGVWAWDPPRQVKPGEKPFDFYSFLSGLANAQLLQRLDAKKDKPTKPTATVTLYGEAGTILEKAEFGPLKGQGQVAASAMKNQVVVAASNLLSSLPPDEPAAPAAQPSPAAATAPPAGAAH